MSVISTGNHPKALWPGVKAFWGRKYNEHAEEWRDLVKVVDSDKNYEELVQVTGFGLATVKSEGGAVSYDSEQQGFTTRATHVVYGLGYIVTEEEMEDNLYEEVSNRRAGANAFSMRQTKENVVANVYNRAFNSSYTGGDAKELLATDHPNSTGGTWQNELTVAADLSESSLEDLIVLIMGATNDRGMKIGLMPQSLIVPRQEWFNANRILKSTLQSGTANNDINVLKATNALPGGIKLNHYLTDADAFFIRTNAESGLTLFQRRAIKFDMDNDFDTNNAKAKSTERYSVIWGDPRTLYGTPGA